jgi:RimJ/RimL family protein N-acetyltransferase
MTVLRTARLVLRPKSPEDFDGYHALVSDFEVVKWTATWPFPADPDFTRFRLAQPQPQAGLAAVILKDGALIGSAALARAEIGYMLAQPYWGRGYATEAMTALIDWGFSLGHARLTAGVFDGNEASIRLLLRLGFAETGGSPGPCRARGVDLPGRDFALDRAAWDTRPPIEFPAPPT